MALEVAALMVLWSMWWSSSGDPLDYVVVLTPVAAIPFVLGLAFKPSRLLPLALLASFPVSLLAADLVGVFDLFGIYDFSPFGWTFIMTFYYGGAATVCYGLGVGARILVSRLKASKRGP